MHSLSTQNFCKNKIMLEPECSQCIFKIYLIRGLVDDQICFIDSTTKSCLRLDQFRRTCACKILTDRLLIKTLNQSPSCRYSIYNVHYILLKLLVVPSHPHFIQTRLCLLRLTVPSSLPHRNTFSSEQCLRRVVV